MGLRVLAFPSILSGGTITGSVVITGTLEVQGLVTASVGQVVTGAANITVQSSTAFTAARSGTNYAFQVDTDTTNSATGLKVTAAAAGGGVALAGISSGANEAVTFNAKGSGTITIGGSSSGVVHIGTGGGYAHFDRIITAGGDAIALIGSTGISIGRNCLGGSVGAVDVRNVDTTQTALYVRAPAAQTAPLADFQLDGTPKVRITPTNLVMYDDVLILRDVNAGLVASTTQTQGQGALTAEVNEVATVANANDTVTMPGAVAGLRVVVINNGANTLQIFPASGDDLGAGVNASITLAAGSNGMYQAYNATNWETL